MRQAARIAVLFLLSLLSTAVLAVGAALVSAISLAATTALIVPGTGTPNANEIDEYLPNYWDRYIRGVDPALPPECTPGNDCTLQGINYPASFFPLFFLSGWCVPGRCETWNDSVEEGVANLNAALIETWADNPDEQIIIGGYSQGGAVASNQLRNLAGLSPELKEQITVFLIGNAYNPDGGLFTRLGFLPTIPFIDVTFGPAMPVDTGIDITSVGFQYDPVMYAPKYWGNPLAMLNALAAFDNVHGYYLSPNENDPDPIAYGYTEPELADILATGCPGAYCRVGSEGNKYYMIPAKSLPIINLINGFIPAPLQPFVRPIIELVTPTLKVLIDLGYDWSGDPDRTQYLSILPFNPFQNWIQVGVDLVEAVVEGIQNALGGGSMMIAPADENVTFVAESQRSFVADETSDSSAPPELSLVSDNTAGQTGVIDQTLGEEGGGTGEVLGDGTGEGTGDGTGEGTGEGADGGNDQGVTNDPEGTTEEETTVNDDTVTTGGITDDSTDITDDSTDTDTDDEADADNDAGGGEGEGGQAAA